MTYANYVRYYLEQQIQGVPIYTDKIAASLAVVYEISKKKAAGATAVAIKRIMDKGELPDLRCYQKGVYYRTIVTPFGETGISREKLIADKYLLPDNGYETGLRLLHHMGLTTQMPTEHLLATNAAKNCVRYDSRLCVSICPPRVTVNAENKIYLQTLDVFDLLDKAPIDAENPYSILGDHIRRNGLQYEKLLYYADRFYNRKTIIRLAHTASRKEEII
ncbi:MAG: hypothetical protein IJS22_04115 [Lachnospiraceae bacterium]|nr:hypothetical protein [Lachnospiraceae bacterium]